MDILTLGLIGVAGAGGYFLYKSGNAQGLAQNSGIDIGGNHIGNDTLNSLASGIKDFASSLTQVGGQPLTSYGNTAFSAPPPPPPPPFAGGDPATGGVSGQGFAGSSADDWANPFDYSGGYVDDNSDPYDPNKLGSGPDEEL